MGTSTKLLSLLLVFTILFSFASCAGNPSGDDTPSGGTPETQAPIVDIIADGVTEYIVVRSENASAAEIEMATYLRAELSRLTGADVRIETDWVKRGEEVPPGAKEIVVGRTNRPQSQRAVDEMLRERDFAVFMENDRISIVGGDNERTSAAVDFFLANYVDGTAKKLSVPENLMLLQRYAYPVGSLKVGGADIAEYAIVIPERADLFEVSTAELLQYYIQAKTGYLLPIVSDSKPEKTNEFLIGKTSRSASSKFKPGQYGNSSYILSGEGSKVVIFGDNYMVAGGAGEFINEYLKTDKPGDALDITIPRVDSPKKFEFKEPNNAILMIGDGMGFNHIKITEAQGGIGQFSASFLPVAGEAKTNSLSGLTDSAAAGTALSSGYKTINRYLGLDKDKKARENISELAKRKGYSAGVISTDLATGATPSAFAVHVLDRASTAEIQTGINAADIDYYDADMGDNLLRSIKAGLDLLENTGTKGFFLMVEEGIIDKHGHSNDAAGVISTTKRFHVSIAYVISYVICNPDTVLIITADHETGGLMQNADGSFKFTSGDHTPVNVPIFAIGRGTEIFSGKAVENIEIPLFLITVFGETAFLNP